MMFPLVRNNGRHLFDQLSCDMERVFGQALAPAAAAIMPVDIREEGDNLVFDVEVPGVAQEELDITVENGTLTIAVNRKTESEQPSNGYVLRERRAGNTTRTFRLPETADLDKVEARLTNGVLTLRIPKREEAKPRQIPIK